MKTSSEIKNQYQKRFAKYGVSPKSLYWKGRGAAHQRFRQFWAEIDFNNKSVLDVGCGFGEFGKFLVKRYKNVSYTGIDIVPEFINEAKKNLPDLNFDVCDYLTNPTSQKYDVVIASGILNSNVENNLEYRKKAISTLFKMTGKVLAFNMLGMYPIPKNDPSINTWYADSLEILKFCLSLTRRVIFRTNYNPKDFTIFMYPVRRK
jgi:SAM-dependent methyltransferase